MEIVLFIFYLAIFCFAISSIPFFNGSGLGKYTLLTLFIIKVSAGFAYAKFFSLPQYYEGADTWRFYRQSVIETKWLLSDPSAFLKDLFTYGYSNPGNLFSGENTYWNDLKSNMVVKMMAVMNTVTNNSYYVNIIIFNFLFLFGLVALARLFNHIFPNRKWIIIAGVFLLPSTLFWCSGVHKDGLILSATGITIYVFKKFLEKRFLAKYIAAFLLSFLLVFSLRNYVLFAIAPALICWMLSVKFPAKKLTIFPAVYFCGLCLFFLVPLIIPSLDFPYFITQKQQEFLQLQGGSKVNIEPLQPSFMSFVSFLPNALDMAFLRPHFNEIKNFSYIPAAIEIVMLILLLMYCIFKADLKQLEPAVMFFLFFSISIMLLAGYTIPFTSAIVRYRSFAWPFMITPLLCLSQNNRSFKRSNLSTYTETKHG